MIVEDEPALRLALTEMLSIWDITPLVFSDGIETMAWLDQVENPTFGGSVPELAMLDVRLPKGPQGHEIARRLRATPKTAHMAIAMITAYRFNPEERAAIMQIAQPDLFINKPFPDPDRFREMLEAALKGRIG